MSWPVLIGMTAAFVVGVALGASMCAKGRVDDGEEIALLRRLLQENNIAIWWEQ